MTAKVKYGKQRFRTIAPEENFPSTPKLNLTQIQTLTEGLFSSETIVWLTPNPKINPNLDPNPNHNRGAVFIGRGGRGRGGLFGYYKQKCDDEVEVTKGDTNWDAKRKQYVPDTPKQGYLVKEVRSFYSNLKGAKNDDKALNAAIKMAKL